MPIMKFNVTRAELGLRTKYIGRKIYYTEVTETTMQDAEHGAKLKGDPCGTVYIAGHLTKARGTKGRTWTAEQQDNLYMSFIVHKDVEKDTDPTVDRSQEFSIDICGALSALQALKEVGIPRVKVKWLNDLWIRGHKILGALTEYKGKIQVGSSEKELYILGIGLNMNTDVRRDDSLHEIATSTLCELGINLSVEDMFARICNHLEPLLANSRADLMELFAQHELIKTGDTVKVFYDKLKHERLGVLYKVREDWSVELKDMYSGKLFIESCADISIRPHTEKQVCILENPHLETWSPKSLQQTCTALVNTAKYKVNFITQDNFTEDMLQLCVLLVVGEFRTSAADHVKLVSAIQEFVVQGGACLSVGNACSLFQLNTIPDPEEDKGKKPAVIAAAFYDEVSQSHATVNLCSLHNPADSLLATLKSEQVLANKQTVKCRTGNEDNVEVIHQVEGSTLPKNPTEIERLTKLPEVNKQCKGSGDKRASSSEELDLVQNKTINSGQAIAVQGGKSGHLQGKEEPAFCIYNIGKGKLCLCWPNIEISYSNVQTVCRTLSSQTDSLKNTVFQRDRLFMNILHKLEIDN